MVDKPAGVAVERQLHGYPSVEEWAWQYLSQHSRKPFVGIVHRLDRPVSGVLLLAKKPLALKMLNRQFAERQVKKIYQAIVESRPPAASGMWRHWLSKDDTGKKALAWPEPVPGSMECVLRYRHLKDTVQGSLLEIEPLQGRFHQIRVQLAAAGMPILGDTRYGAAKPWQPDAIALRAVLLRFRDPQTGDPVLAEAPSWDAD